MKRKTLGSLRTEAKSRLIAAHGLPLDTRAVFLVDISDDETRSRLIEALSMIGASSLIYDRDDDDLSGSDAFVTDHPERQMICEMMILGVTPILPRDTPLSGIETFDVMGFSGNAFLYESRNIYSIFEQVVRYLEIVRYPGDRRVLLQNVQKGLPLESYSKLT